MDRFRTMQSFVEVIRLGSFSEAAKLLGLSRDALRYRMEKYGISTRRDGEEEA